MIPSEEGSYTLQLVFPQINQKKALQGCHDDIRDMELEQMLLKDPFIGPE